MNWNSPLEKLFRSKKTKTCEKLQSAGFQKLEDLLWLIPLRTQELPLINSFTSLNEGELFSGQGQVLSIQARPNFRVRGKRGIPLQNITLTVKDSFSSDTLQLKWFNTYPSLKDKLSKAQFLKFTGTAQIYQGQWQIVTPDIEVLTDDEILNQIPTPGQNHKPVIRIQYPTINGVSTTHIKQMMDRIPKDMWISIQENMPPLLLSKHNLLNRSDAFQLIHGLNHSIEWNKSLIPEAKRRLIFEEIYLEQIKILARRGREIKKSAPVFSANEEIWKSIEKVFPYELTVDQKQSILDIKADFLSGHPMMRLIQGDVGCGKTSVAMVVSLIAIKSGFQVAFMCPTESLAQQHFQTINELIRPIKEDFNIQSTLLLGGYSAKEKKEIQEKIKSGEVNFVFGTHSLFQKSVEFKQLGLAIIDEQHKFGVNQRLELLKKGGEPGVHCLIMTATPIPRSLSLTQYGDLDITTIKQLPGGRPGIKTRIVEQENFKKFLSFIKTRASMKEQIYVVVPAITESQNQDILNLESTLEQFKKYFPDLKVQGLHGQMSTEEKNQTLQDFKAHQFDILISTSVIEVGINIINATVMAIFSPERFGLSSLHQLRGRVGRGDKPGFCFLVLDKQVSKESLTRLKVIEDHLDGFKISEEDLKIRGEGNLFGVEQSGAVSHRKISNILTHQPVLIEIRNDLDQIKGTPEVLNILNSLSKDEKILSTI